MSTSDSPQKHIIIRPYSFNTPLSATLITALDNELSEMYTDWEDLPHPGFQHGKVGGDSLTADESHNPKPQTAKDDAVEKSYQVWDDRELPVLTADNDIEPSTSSTAASTDPVPVSMQGLTTSTIQRLHFHIAFDTTSLPQEPSPPVPTSTLASTSPAIACIGLKLMPYFPYHRMQPTPPAEGYSPTRHAEFKRIYVAPEYRGVRTQSGQRLVEALLDTVVVYARDVLGVQRLVLETGVRQLAAIRVYERAGWRRREVFGDYVGAGVEVGGVSLCYELDL